MGFEPTISAGERPQTYALDYVATGIGRHHLVRWLNTKPRIIQSDIYMAHYVPSTQNTTIWSLLRKLPIIFGFCEHKLVKTGSSDSDPLFLSICYHHHKHKQIYSWPMFRMQHTAMNIHTYVTASSSLWDLWILYSNDHRQHHHSPVSQTAISWHLCVQALCLQTGVRKEMTSENGRIAKAACSSSTLTAVNNFYLP